MQKLLDKLKQAAQENQEKIESGEWWREQLSDAEFSELVTPEQESELFTLMLETGEWQRVSTGFIYIPADR